MRLLLGGFLRLGFGSVGEKRRLRRHRLLWGEEEMGGDDFIEGERRALIGGGAGAADRYLRAAQAVDAFSDGRLRCAFDVDR